MWNPAKKCHCCALSCPRHGGFQVIWVLRSFAIFETSSNRLQACSKSFSAVSSAGLLGFTPFVVAMCWGRTPRTKAKSASTHDLLTRAKRASSVFMRERCMCSRGNPTLPAPVTAVNHRLNICLHRDRNCWTPFFASSTRSSGNGNSPGCSR